LRESCAFAATNPLIGVTWLNWKQKGQKGQKGQKRFVIFALFAFFASDTFGDIILSKVADTRLGND
jgi:hypothetical protein